MNPPEPRASLRLRAVAVLDRAATGLYDRICGVHPAVYPWHWQWMAVRDLHRDLRTSLSAVTGRVLDVGCGNKPYLTWFKSVPPSSIVGIDIEPGPGVDVVIGEGQPWPFPAASFDMVLCTQVLEHASDVDFVMAEIHRVLAPGGQVVITVPFIYYEHGAPRDFRRFSRHETTRLLPGSYDILRNDTQGGLGSTLSVLLLAWLRTMWDRRSPTRMLKIPLLPLWLIVTALLNGMAVAIDFLDRTASFYSNVILVARKRASDQ
ncbi:hypothetical protein GETHOR_21620 [Geothrix oryzae]|uniref:Methyltransferase type 11 domain-containing protein n=1 Tax=Geothrix oryzae TaxID=2927975 RepID=A0ABM8DSL7_9BACT|nr:class I SAM-dependent methyltransferase [Geothrix oryzae]BDU70061.1 hypothetical protein GETHOR_21620 [Geothrix oryzae]